MNPYHVHKTIQSRDLEIFDGLINTHLREGWQIDTFKVVSSNMGPILFAFIYKLVTP